MRLLIRNGHVVDPSQQLDEPADLLIEEGKVARVGHGLRQPAKTEVYDAEGQVVCPGLIDMHVHLREPGQEYKETIESGSRAAAAGGFTAVACMPNTVPVNDQRTVTEYIVNEAERCGFARVYPIGAVTVGQKGEELAEIGEMVAGGAVAISDDGHPVSSSEAMRRALEYSRHFDIPVIQHAEDLTIGHDGVMHEGAVSTRLGLPGLPGVAEDAMIARDLLLAGDFGGRYHVAHLSTARSLDLVREGKRRGLDVTCEVSPHHLLLNDSAVLETGMSTDTKMKPPLRSEDDRLAMIAGLEDGAIDAIASDHAPHHRDEKLVEFSLAPFGIVGLETTLSLCLDRLVKPGLISLSRLVELLSTNPARILKIEGGTLAEGSRADVTVFSRKSQFTANPMRFQSKGRNTPFAGWKLRGRPITTFLAGRRVEL